MILITDIPYSRFALNLTNLIADGIKVEIFPKISCITSKEIVYVVAYSGPLPENVVDFLCASDKEKIRFFLSREAVDSLGSKITLPHHFISSQKEAALDIFSATSKFLDSMRTRK